MYVKYLRSFSASLGKAKSSQICTHFHRHGYLRIANDRYQTIGMYCGWRTGQTVRVTGNYSMIYFYSDGIVQSSGYDLSFSYVTSGKYRADVSVEPQAAQGRVTRERVIINHWKIWTIYRLDEMFVNVEFTDFLQELNSAYSYLSTAKCL